jgi:hypothetical protein
MQQVEHRAERLGLRSARQTSRNGPALRQARRTANQKQTGGELLRCECSQLGCRSVVPAVAEGSRGDHDGFIVVPGHIGHDIVVGAADRFFVVELRPSRSP